MATESPLITTNFPRHQVCDWACELAPLMTSDDV